MHEINWLREMQTPKTSNASGIPGPTGRKWPAMGRRKKKERKGVGLKPNFRHGHFMAPMNNIRFVVSGLLKMDICPARS